VDFTSEPYKLIGFRRFKGGDVSIPAQYQLVDEVTRAFNSKLIIDSSALGGKNAMAFLGHLNPISQEFGPTRSSTLKMDMLASLKIALDGGQASELRRVRKEVDGNWVDENENWGLLRIPNIPVLINELQNYKLDDSKIRQDCVMCLAMIIHWLEMRRPKMTVRRAVDVDFYAGL
jgi:hypothetical protein